MAKKQKSTSSKAPAGKVANDNNQQGGQQPTQKNEGKRTPQSRSDRESQAGSDNQSQTRKGSAGGGKGR